MPFTTRGMKLMLDAYFRNGTEPTVFYLALVTSATAPAIDTKTLSQLTEIAAGNGYTSGGLSVARNSTDFSSLAEDDTAFRVELAIKTESWTAGGGNIPASGDPARYMVLITDEATIPDRQIIWYQSLGADKTVTSGNVLTVTNIKARILGGSVIKSIQRGTITIANTATSNTATVTSVDTTKSELRKLGDSASNDSTAHLSYVQLTNATTITATRSGNTGTTIISYELIEYF